MRLRAHPEGSVLGRIVASKVAEVAAREVAAPRASLERGLRASDRDFAAALAWGRASTRPRLIAEIKRRSPSKGVLRADVDVAAFARTYSACAAAISVVCDGPFFGGSVAMLTEARAATALPVLLKDFVVSEYQVVEARAAGADAVLLMASVLEVDALSALLALARSLGMEALVEAHTAEELDAVLSTTARVVGINNRDLDTLRIDPEHFHRLAPAIGDRVRVAESGIESREALDRLAGLADAVLIGTALMTAPDPAQRLRDLGW